jgi:magnesium chelatase family protein
LPDGIEMLDRAVATGSVSPRGVDKTLRLAWTISDLAGRPKPGREELSTALAMRRGEQGPRIGVKAG